jgi:hypothetical protein
MNRLTFSTLALAGLAACATPPGSIAPVPMFGAFDALPCQAAADRLAQTEARLAADVAAQRDTVGADFVGVAFLGMPIGSMTGGDREAAIAVARGEVLALEARLRGCR